MTDDCDGSVPSCCCSTRERLVGRLLLFVFSVCAIAVLARVVQLQVVPPEQLAALIDDRVGARPELAPRGDILDRRGRLLAATRTGHRLFVDPLRFPKPYDESIVALADAADLDPDVVGKRVLSRIAENERRERTGENTIRYVSLGGVLAASRVEMVRALEMRGVHLETRSVRGNPGLSPSLAGIVGKVGVEHEGRLGAEYAFDAPLAPEHGAMRFVHDARGRALWIEAGGYDTPEHGQSVRLSIDSEIQRIAEEEAERALEDMDAAGARILVVDPSTGEILAMVDRIRAIDGAVPMATPREQPGRRVVVPPDPKRLKEPALARNRCVEDAYEPGSTFKPFMWSAVTQLGLASQDEMVDTENGLWRTPYGRRIEDVVPLDEQTWRDVLVHSSNIGMTKITDRMTDRQMQEAISSYGFGSVTDLGLMGESPGLVTSARNWNKYTRTSVSFGYEVAVTTLQMARAYCAFARQGHQAGTMPSLRLTAAPPGESTSPTTRVLPVRTAMLARSAMVDVVANMDNRLIQAGILDAQPKYSMFGKSGTSRVADTSHGGYFERQYISSFVAGAPAEAPRIIVIAVVDDPGPHLIEKRQHYGSWVGGPIARRIIERTLPYLGVAPSFSDEQFADVNEN